MAVSYKSTPIRSSAYVPPVSLELFAKVLGTEQQQSDINAAKVQQGIDQLGTLDVIRDADRQYLNTKIKNLVDNTNSLGGADFKDPNVLNQIEGLSSDIYSDNKVINAIASTKQVRKLTAGYEKYKTDPKLSKQYGQQNEAWDMRKVNQWLQDPEVGKSYEGPSAPSPYVNYRESHFKMFDKIVADKYEKDTVDGFYIDRETKERVMPDRIWAQAEELLMPQERDQIKKDGWFLYTQTGKLAPQDLINKGLNQVNQRFNDTKYLKDYYEAQADAAVSDPAQRMRFNALANQKAAEMTSLSKDPLYTADAAIKSYQSDPEEFMYQVYKNDYFKGLADRFSVNKTSTTTRADQVGMYIDRKAQAEKQFDAKMAQDDKQFYADLDLKYFQAGMKMIVDPKTGAIKGVPLIGENGIGLSSTTINTESPEDARVTPKSLREMNTSSELEKQGVYDRLIEDLAAKNPELGLNVPNLLGTGHHRELIGQQYLENINQKPGFQLEDLQAFEQVPVIDQSTGKQKIETRTNPDGTTTQIPVFTYKSEAAVGQVRGALKNAGTQDVTKSLEVLTRFWNNYKTILDGKGHTVGELPPEFVDAVGQVQLINERQRTNNAIQKQAAQLVLNQTDWSAEDKAIFTDYLSNPEKYESDTKVPITQIGPFTINKGVHFGSRTIDRLKNDLDRQGIKPGKIMDQFFNSLSTRDVFQTHIFTNTDEKVADGTLPKFGAAELALGHGNIYYGGKKYEGVPFNIPDVNKIKPIQSGVMSDGTGRFFIQYQFEQGEGKDAVNGQAIIPLSDAQASTIGLKRDPVENINYSVKMLGDSGDLNVYGNNNLAVTIQVSKKNLKALNDNSSFALVKVFSKDANGNPTGKFTRVPIPGSDGLTPADAYRAANALVQNAARLDEELRKNGQPGGSTEDFINWIIENRK